MLKNTTVALLLALLVSNQALAGSTINPAIPAPNAPMSSAPIRNNFQAAYNDINNILTKFGSPNAPIGPSLRQDWVNTSGTPWIWNVWDGTAWVQIGTINASSHVFTPVAGGPPGGAAGGDLSGTYPNPTVVQVDGTRATNTLVAGPASAVSANVATFNGTGGKTIQDSGKALPSGVVVGTTDTQTLANKTLTSPTMTTPTLGAASATSINGLTITSSTGTLTVTNAKTLSISNSLTLAGTDGSTLNVGAGGSLGSNAFSSVVFAPVASPTFTGTVTIPALTLSSITGSTQCLRANSSGVVSGAGADCSSATPVSFQAYLLSGAQTVTSGTNTKVSLDTISIDSGSYWDAANKQYKPLVAGTYQVCGNVHSTGTTITRVIAYVSKNGTIGGTGSAVTSGTIVGSTAASENGAAAVCALVAMNGSTDTLELDTNTTGTGTVQVTNDRGTSLSITRYSN